MSRILGLTLAAVMVLVGGVWTFQGLGYVEGSFMTDQPAWAIIGPVVAAFGVALGIVIVQRSRRS